MYSDYEKLRNKKGVTDYRVAKDSGVGRTTISDWKLGKHTPNLKNMTRLANYFKVPLDKIAK